MRDNLQIQTNVVDAAWRNGVRKLVFLGSRLSSLGWSPRVSLEDGIRATYEWMQQHTFKAA